VVPQFGRQVLRDADLPGAPGHWHSALWPAVPHPGPLPGGAGAGRLGGGKRATEALCLAAGAQRYWLGLGLSFLTPFLINPYRALGGCIKQGWDESTKSTLCP